MNMITINARGARTIAQSRPLVIDDQYVYVAVGQNVAELHIGGRNVAECPAFQINSVRAAQDWAYRVIEARPGA